MSVGGRQFSMHVKTHFFIYIYLKLLLSLDPFSFRVFEHMFQ